MSVTLENVKNIAELARLQITEDMLESYRGHMNEILEYVDKLNEIDTEGIEPTVAVQSSEKPLRSDELKSSLSIDEAMANAPSHARSFFRVPKVINSGGTA